MKKLCSLFLSVGILGSFLSVPAQAHDPATALDDECCVSAAQTYAIDDGEVDAETGFRPDRVYYIRNVRSGLYLDAENDGVYNETRILQKQYQEQHRQQWHIYKTSDGYYQMSPLHAHDMNMGLGYNISSEEAKIELWTRNISTDKWTIVKNSNRTDRSYHILSQFSGKAMAIQNASNAEGAKLVQAAYTNDGIRNDEWVFEPVMETEIYYDTGLLQKYDFTPAQAEEKLTANFMEVADCFYQRFGIRYQTPRCYKNISVADSCGTPWDQACPHAENHKYPGNQLEPLTNNLSGHTLRVQMSGHYHSNVEGSGKWLEPVMAGRTVDNFILLAHEMTHNFGRPHHDNVGGTDVMNKPGIPNSVIWEKRPNLWCADCEATILKNSALFSTYQDTAYPQSETLSVDRSTMDYMITEIPRHTTVKELRGMLEFETTSSFRVVNAENNNVASGSAVATGYIIPKADYTDQYAYMLVVKGDVTGDGLVTVMDVQAVTKIIARKSGGIPPTYKELKIADINNDGDVTILDVQAITKMIAQDAA